MDPFETAINANKRTQVLNNLVKDLNDLITLMLEFKAKEATFFKSIGKNDLHDKCIEYIKLIQDRKNLLTNNSKLELSKLGINFNNK